MADESVVQTDGERCLRRRICQLETTDPQRRIEELEGTICGLHAKNEELKA